MKISDLVKFGEYEVLTNPDYEDKEILAVILVIC